MASLIAGVFGGCSSDPEADRDARDLDARVTVADWPNQAGSPVIRVDTGGGLPLPERPPERFAEVPDFVLYGDGLAVWRREGSFTSARLDQDGVRTVLGWVTVAGLAEEGGARAGEPDVYDAPSTRFEVTTSEGTFTTVLQAPGLDPGALGLSRKEIAVRKLLGDVYDRLFALDEFLPDERFEAVPGPLQPTGWELLGRRATTYPDLTGDEPAWDLAGRISGCRRVTGAEQVRLEALLADAGRDPAAGSMWASAGARWVVFARPLLPGAPEPCPAEPQAGVTPAGP